MTLLEMSAVYLDSAAALHDRITELRNAAKSEKDPDALFHLRCRIDALMPLWRESRELAALTAHYYERSYHRHEKYTL